MLSSPKGIRVITPGNKIAQMLILPSQHDLYAYKNTSQGTKGFGSSGEPLACLTLGLQDRPLLTLTIRGRDFLGLLDTGADKSLIRSLDWPKDWPIVKANQTLQGLGVAQSPDQSAATLQWKDREGHTGLFQPYICALPISLWGRDILAQMDLKLTTENLFNGPVKGMMQSMGRGLGKQEQGITQPIPLSEHF